VIQMQCVFCGLGISCLNIIYIVLCLKESNNRYTHTHMIVTNYFVSEVWSKIFQDYSGTLPFLTCLKHPLLFYIIWDVLGNGSTSGCRTYQGYWAV